VAKPLHESLVALVSTGGFYGRGVQPAFDAANIEGDLSYRTFSRTVPPGQLGIAHDHFPHHYAEADINAILPLDHMSDFEREGLIGECEDTIYSITGYPSIPRRSCRPLPKRSPSASRAHRWMWPS
jgi:Glycine/sarcosine/betaine reductase selenoprotein B (GRDB)